MSLGTATPIQPLESPSEVTSPPELKLNGASHAAASNTNGVHPPPAATRTPHEEYQYLDLISQIIDSGEKRPDRTGTGTLSVFAPPPFRFSLRDNALPLLTTKRVFLRGVLEELLWFVHACTDSKVLSERGVKIWDGNGSREYLDKVGLSHRREGDLGPVYGFQWRHFGAEYRGVKDEVEGGYEGEGVDQLKECIWKIKNNPTDRRIIMSAWNPKDLPHMALPPCHMFCQFYVHLPQTPGEKPGLSCQMYQRSCDLGLGIPFNIASYALLTHMIAHVTGSEARELVLVMGDAHVYLDHVEALKEQLLREPRAFPTIRWAREVEDIDDIKYDDIEVAGYKPHAKLEMKMSV